MVDHASGGALRLAELVAALSLGVDLGFGQPMEHVLRQSRIALRLAELAGLDDGQRSVVYYTSLLVNVGCHSDAHEQAKWFGDDIAMKATKYDHPLRSAAGAPHAPLRRPPACRSRRPLRLVCRDRTAVGAGRRGLRSRSGTTSGGTSPRRGS
jgi:hypothetical protein